MRTTPKIKRTVDQGIWNHVHKSQKYLQLLLRQQFVLGINCSIFLYRNSVGANQRLALTRKSISISNMLYYLKNITHICGIKGCGGAGWPPPPIIFERLKLPQQIVYRRKENLSESPNHQKYWENILVSRFYKQFSRNRRNLGHFRKFEKISNS